MQDEQHVTEADCRLWVSQTTSPFRHTLIRGQTNVELEGGIRMILIESEARTNIPGPQCNTGFLAVQSHVSPTSLPSSSSRSRNFGG